MLRELRKVYMFCINGDLSELQVIFELLKVEPSDHVLQLLYLWTLHSNQTIAYSLEGHKLLSDLLQFLIRLEPKKIVFEIVSAGHHVFLRTNRQQVQWFECLLGHPEELVRFCAQYVEDSGSVFRNFYMKDSKIEYEPKVEKQLNPGVDIVSLYPKLYVHASQESFIEWWSRLLIVEVEELSKQENFKNHFLSGFYIDAAEEGKLLSEHSEVSIRFWEALG